MNKFNPNRQIAVIGLGYVGLPLACLFSKRYEVVGFDKSFLRTTEIANAYDRTGEVSVEELCEAKARGFTCAYEVEDIRPCNTYIVAVPTPVDVNHAPDLSALINVSGIIGGVVKPGDLVIFESTVYPGVTEDECIPMIECVSGLKLNVDFFAGYSPERINPGDKSRPLESIVKVIAGSCPEATDRMEELYNSVLLNPVFRAASIKVAEASKIMENTQRDVNIAFMNDMAKVLNAMSIDTQDVIAAASTKWNFVKVTPGLVGGHCISVDPYYIIQKAQVYGVYPRIMSEARRLNDGMGAYIADSLLKVMNRKGILPLNSRILILGCTFKEDCPDTRNTKVVDIIATLREYTPHISLHDPCADPDEFEKEYRIPVSDILPDGPFDGIILAVAHTEYRTINLDKLKADNCAVYDVKGILPKDQVDGRL
jgi:UDP-N-acetyl-D-galactosamine dehydrogenase